jgi:cyclohexyl-isocyanide hydratase
MESKILIGMPVYEDVDLLDITGPYEMFAWADFEVLLVAREAGLVRTRSGLKLQVDVDFASAPAFDVLWTPGGDPNALAALMGEPDRDYLDFLIRQSAGARYTCSVCEGALLLAAAGLLDGYQATTHWAFIPCLTERFPLVQVVPDNPRYCLDRDRLTGGGISSGLDEALALIQLLKGTGVAQSVQQSTQYYPRPPVTSQIPTATSCPVSVVVIPPPNGSCSAGPD